MNFQMYFLKLNRKFLLFVYDGALVRLIMRVFSNLNGIPVCVFAEFEGYLWTYACHYPLRKSSE